MAERTYQTHDKSSWPRGPWDTEPDKVQFVDADTGLPCLAVRNRAGAWCGYVGVAEGHPAFEKNYDDVNVEVHGGPTFANFCQAGDEAKNICHVAEPGRPDRVWWLGFDCVHCGDLTPKDARLRGGSGGFGETYRDLEYVRSECTSLAKQLANMALVTAK